MEALLELIKSYAETSEYNSESFISNGDSIIFKDLDLGVVKRITGDKPYKITNITFKDTKTHTNFTVKTEAELLSDLGIFEN